MGPKHVNTDHETILCEFKRLGVYQEGKFSLTSGKKSDFFIDVQRALRDPSLLWLVGKELRTLIPSTTDILAGPAFGAIPLLAVLGLGTMLPFKIITPEYKQEEEGNEENILLIDDVTTTGGSLLHCAEILRNYNYKVESAVVVVDREEGAKEALNNGGIQLIHLLTADKLRG